MYTLCNYLVGVVPCKHHLVRDTIIPHVRSQGSPTRTNYLTRPPAHLLLALDILTLTTHRIRDGAPFLLRIETPPTFERSLRLFHTSILHRNCLLILSPSCLAVCGHHRSCRIAIVSGCNQRSVPNFSMGGGTKWRTRDGGNFLKT